MSSRTYGWLSRYWGKYWVFPKNVGNKKRYLPNLAQHRSDIFTAVASRVAHDSTRVLVACKFFFIPVLTRGFGLIMKRIREVMVPIGRKKYAGRSH